MRLSLIVTSPVYLRKRVSYTMRATRMVMSNDAPIHFKRVVDRIMRNLEINKSEVASLGKNKISVNQ